jgi:hypothetical protein
LALRGNDISSDFRYLIEDSFKKYSKPAVVIVDEYDSPLLSVINDKKTFNKMKELLRDFYKIVKMSEEKLVSPS